jgi:hypothetical protein
MGIGTDSIGSVTNIYENLIDNYGCHNNINLIDNYGCHNNINLIDNYGCHIAQVVLNPTTI